MASSGDNGSTMPDVSSSPPTAVPVFDDLLAKLRARRGHVLEAGRAAEALAAEGVDDAAKTKFLRELSEDLWTPNLLAEFAKTFRALARNPHVEAWAGRAMDLCGTGGDHSGSFNVSTAAAFVVAAARVPVFKHGNRALTLKSGSADFLEKVGLPIEATDAVWRSALRELNFAFFYAPAFHPAFARVAPARKALAKEGRRTVFNLLGPLVNPDGRSTRWWAFSTGPVRRWWRRAWRNSACGGGWWCLGGKPAAGRGWMNCPSWAAIR